jgi:hypothetical protein
LYYESYYDRISRFLKSQKEEKIENKIDNVFSHLKINKLVYQRIRKRYEQERNAEYLYQRVKEDLPKLEKLYKDTKYKEEMHESYFEGYLTSIPKYELSDLYGLERLVKEKLGIPDSAIIKFEKVKCCKKCKHNTHRYFYAYHWNSKMRKLKKKYIGKHLPQPFNFSISYQQ